MTPCHSRMIISLAVLASKPINIKPHTFAGVPQWQGQQTKEPKQGNLKSSNWPMHTQSEPPTFAFVPNQHHTAELNNDCNMLLQLLSWSLCSAHSVARASIDGGYACVGFVCPAVGDDLLTVSSHTKHVWTCLLYTSDAADE